MRGTIGDMSDSVRMEMPAVMSALEQLTEEELVQLNHVIVARIRLIQQIRTHNKMFDFRVGQRVRFSSASGEVIRGVVKSHNRKSVTVLSETSGSWRVSPQFLEAE